MANEIEDGQPATCPCGQPATIRHGEAVYCAPCFIARVWPKQEQRETP